MTKVIVLAAGEGSRLRPLTLEIPKCMVNVGGKPIIEHQLETFENCQAIDKIIIIKGYKQEKIKYSNVIYYLNPEYNSTNMVYTFFKAVDQFNTDIIISYGDIIYKDEVLNKLISTEGEIVTVVDLEWEKLWKARMEDVLKDAETLKISKNGDLIEIGKKPKDISEIQGQYIGLTKIKASAIQKIIEFYNSLDKQRIYDGKNFQNMFMTTFLQLLIDNGFIIRPALIKGGWIEIDEPNDLTLFNEFINK